MLKWAPKIIAGSCYDLTHMHPFEIDYSIEAKDGKPAQAYRLYVGFSIHCFTRAIEPDDGHDHEWEYADSRETRIFDLSRYHLSFRIRDTVLNLGKAKCFHTGHGNFFVVEWVAESGEKIEYGVYFHLVRPKGEKRITLFVQSAYPHSRLNTKRPKPRKPVSFNVLVFNTFNGKPIKAPQT